MEKVKFIYLDVGDTLIHIKTNPGKIYYDILKSHNIIQASYDKELLKKYFFDSWKFMNSKAPLNFQCRYTNHKYGNDGFWKELIGYFLSFFEKTELTEKVYLDIVNTFNDPNSWAIDETFFNLKEFSDKKNIQLGIISNWDIRLRSLLKNMNLLKYFTHIVISSEFGYEKPSEKIFIEGEKLAQVSPKNLIYVGDKPELDYFPPRKLGWNTFLISSNNDPDLETLRQLGDLMEKIY
ncbi:MAG: HAD-IA family hydrolase [Leptospiraceae bacterium]|nr:HAD-IA family hydrolase [Leptospiraceae bacterium]MCK6382629.1 HAD-IA family hydrolase [Leptospiraceae bacterium]NUM42504.1 HAD-IA family hydrolase [Leptospiraceae bacterium]